MRPDSRLGRLLGKIEGHYGRPELPPFRGVFEAIRWEIVAYLAAFDALRARVGLTPPQILAAPKAVLCEITRLVGGGPDRGGPFSAAISTAVLKLPSRKRRRRHAVPDHRRTGGREDSDVRGGAGRAGARIQRPARERKGYSATYKSVREVTLEELLADCRLLTKAHLLLRQHGQRLCLRNGPA